MVYDGVEVKIVEGEIVLGLKEFVNWKVLCVFFDKCAAVDSCYFTGDVCIAYGYNGGG